MEEVVRLAGYLLWSIAHLACLGLMLLCAAGLGNVLLRKYRFDNLAERLTFTIALGLGLCSILLFFLALLGFLYQSLIWVLTLSGALAVALKYAHKTRTALPSGWWKHLPSIFRQPEVYTVRNGVVTLLSFLAIAY